MLYLSSIAMFGLVFCGSIRLYNLAIASAGKSSEAGLGIDLLVAFFATALFITEKIS